VIPRHHDSVDAGGIGRAQARAEIARILDAVEHEQPYRTAAIDDELLEIADRELGRRRDFHDDALMNATLGEPVEIAARDALERNAAGRERPRELRELAARVAQHLGREHGLGPPLEDGANRVETVEMLAVSHDRVASGAASAPARRSRRERSRPCALPR
jgi:hypothetical protein